MYRQPERHFPALRSDKAAGSALVRRRLASFPALGIIVCLVILGFIAFSRIPGRSKPFQPAPAHLLNSASASSDHHLLEKARAADKKIHFLKPESYKSIVSGSQSGVWLVFFSVRECPFCQAFTQHWLAFQEQLVSQPLPVHLAKVDCTGQEDLCDDSDGWPTVNAYVNGELKGDLYSDDLTAAVLYRAARQYVL